MLAIQKLAIIGDPIAHSLSPILQSFLIRHFALPFTYETLHVRPNELPQLMERLRAGEFRGINVTLPHKQSVLPFLHRLDATAASIGAVNTIVAEAERLVGYNTDARGFERSLANISPLNVSPTALVLGAGGAARAVIFALIQARVKKIIVSNRSAERAATLLAAFARHAELNQLQNLPWDERVVWLKKNKVELLINTTRVGMHPHDGESPLPAEVFTSTMTVIDLVYNPLQTQFLRAAKLAGAKIVTGLGTLIYQGVAALELWCQQSLAMSEIYSSLEDELLRALVKK